MNDNRLEISGEIAEISALRFTPAGIPVIGLTLRHQSQQMEAGMGRKVECEITAMMMGSLTEMANTLSVGCAIRVTGFLARRSLKSSQLVLHINTLEII